MHAKRTEGLFLADIKIANVSLIVCWPPIPLVAMVERVLPLGGLHITPSNDIKLVIVDRALHAVSNHGVTIEIDAEPKKEVQ